MRLASLPEDPRAIRAGIVQHLTHALQPLFSASIVAELPEWVEPLSTKEIVDCLQTDPSAIADALASALVVDTAGRHPNDAIADLAAVEFPRLSPSARERLVEYTRAVRCLQIDHNGAVPARAVYAAGFASAEAERLKPACERLLRILAREEMPGAGATSAERLRAAGTKAAVRLTFAGAA